MNGISVVDVARGDVLSGEEPTSARLNGLTCISRLDVFRGHVLSWKEGCDGAISAKGPSLVESGGKISMNVSLTFDHPSDVVFYLIFLRISACI